MPGLAKEAGSGGDKPKNPDPTLYGRRLRFTPQELALEAYAGIKESIWVPLSKPTSPTKQFKPTSLHDLRDYKPTRLSFTLKHPSKDWSDEWYETLIGALFCRVNEFAVREFGRRFSIPETYQWSPWTEPFSPQFIRIASRILRKDDHVGGWDVTLTNHRERACLVNAVIARVIDDHVFSKLVFGDSKENNKLWDALDEGNLDEEGWFVRP